MIIEDGTGLENSNSYVSVDFANDYFSARGISDWSGLEDETKENVLVRATDYIDNVFHWYGQKKTKTQALRFPRINLLDYEGTEIEGIPNCLKQAVCEGALILSEGTELYQTSEKNGDITSETIGELSFTYSKSTKESVAWNTLYDSINTKLRGLYKDSSKNRIICGKIERV